MMMNIKSGSLDSSSDANRVDNGSSGSCIGCDRTSNTTATGTAATSVVSKVLLSVKRLQGYFDQRLMLGMIGVLLFHSLYSVPSPIFQNCTTDMIFNTTKQTTIEAAALKQNAAKLLKLEQLRQQQQQQEQMKRKAIPLRDENPKGKIGTIYRTKTFNVSNFIIKNSIKKCKLTAVIHEPRMPFLPSNDILYTSALESVADFTPDGSCLVLQTSSCIMEHYMRLGHDGRNVTYDIRRSAYRNPSLEELRKQQDDVGDDLVDDEDFAEQVLEAISRNIYDRAGIHLKRWIDSGLVRLSILDHEKYNATSCTDFFKQFFLKSVMYWVDEFIGEEKISSKDNKNSIEYVIMDSDTMFMFQRDVVLCKPLTSTYLDPFSRFAYVGGPWKSNGGGSKGVKGMWNDPTKAQRHSNITSSGALYNWTAWNQYWETHVEPFYNPAFVDFNPRDVLLSCDTLPVLRASSIFCPLPTFPYYYGGSDHEDYMIATKDDDGSNNYDPSSYFLSNGTQLNAVVTWPSRYPLHRSKGIVGNGGASLRSRKWMIRAIRSCPSLQDNVPSLDKRYSGINQCTAPGSWEDVYFSGVLNIIGAPLPDPFQSTLFAVENSYSSTFASRNETVVNETLASLVTNATSKHVKEIVEDNIDNKDSNFSYSWSSTSSLLDQYWAEVKVLGRAQAVAEHHCGKVTRCPNRRYCKYSPNKQW